MQTLFQSIFRDDPPDKPVNSLRKLFLARVRRIWVVSTKVFRWIFPKTLILVLLSVWYETVNAHHAWERFFIYLFLVLLLLTVLFFAEALEIAFTFLLDKNVDELGPSEGEIMKRLRKHKDLFYEAREWLVVGIIVGITFMADFETIKFPFVQHEIGYVRIFGTDLPIKWAFIFSLLFTTVPVVWIAQTPGKRVGRSSSQHVLNNTRWLWPIIQNVGSVIEATGLGGPGTWIADQLLKTKSFSPKENFSPSDEGFFLSCLRRYGFALHDLSITVVINADGSCSFRQKFVLYSAKYPRTTFHRRTIFDGGRPLNGRFVSFKGYESPVVVDRNYDEVDLLLDQIADGICPERFKAFPEDMWDTSSTLHPDPSVPDECTGYNLVVKTWNPLPVKDKSCAFAAEWIGEWSIGALKVNDGESDFFQIRTDYPCRTSRLKIVAGSGTSIRLTNIQANATLMGNVHAGEADRLNSSVTEGVDTLLQSTLRFPLPGANYRLSWVVRKLKLLDAPA